MGSLSNCCKQYQKLKVYITGYGPFMSIRENPSQKLVEHIVGNKSTIHSHLDNKCEITHDSIYQVSVDYVKQNVTKCHSCIQECLEKENSKSELHLVVHFGVNSGAQQIHLESTAKNKIRDYVQYDGKIHDEGEEELKCKLDLESVAKHLQGNNHKVSTSDDAGTYLCNYIYYQSANAFSGCDNVIPIFIHIPDLSVCSIEDCHNCFVDFLKVLVEKYIA
jgi:pyroglutamyl-peptidase